MLRCGRSLCRFSLSNASVNAWTKAAVPSSQIHRCMSDLKSPPSSKSANEEFDNRKWITYLLLGATAIGATAYIVKNKRDSPVEKKPAGFKGGRSKITEDDEDDDKPVVPTPLVIGLPESVPYLIIGGGTAAFSAFRAIRSADPKAKVLVIGDESRLPYMRPPLSKELWYSTDHDLVEQLKFKQWNGKERSLFFEKDAFYCKPAELCDCENGGVAIATGQKVVKLDVSTQKAHLSNGQEITYDKCLIATGGEPRNLPITENAGKDVKRRCTLFRRADDFKKLDGVTKKAKSIAIIGGGFMGSELACALGKRGLETGMKVYQIFPEQGNMGAVLPAYLSKWTTDKVKKVGVEIIPETQLKSCAFDSAKKQVCLQLSNMQTLSVDHVVVAVGLDPNVQLAESAGLEVDHALGGYLVNAELEARSNVWVAGDAACFYDMKLGRRRVEHHDHAVVSGRLAGENMAGARKPYWHQSMFWSDLGPDIGYEAIGLVDSTLPTVGVYARACDGDSPVGAATVTGDDIRSDTPAAESSASVTSEPTDQPVDVSPSTDQKDDYGKGVIFYMRNKTVVGVVLWNVFNKIGVARKIIRDGEQYEDLTEVAKLFHLYGDPPTESPEQASDETATTESTAQTGDKGSKSAE